MSQKSSGTSPQSEHGRGPKKEILVLQKEMKKISINYITWIIIGFIWKYYCIISTYIYIYPYNPISNTPLHGKMLILLIYFANIPSANCYDLEDSKQLPILIWDGMYRGLWHWIYHMTVTMPQPLPSQALRKASGSERVSNPKAPTCRDPKLFLISIIFQENNTTIIKSQVKHQTSTVESTVSQMFLS